MKRKLLNRSFLKQTALAVPAAALMLGAAHGGTVGFNLDSYYYDNTGTATKWIPGATPAPDGAGYGYQTSGWVVTAKAFGVEPADWFYAQVFAWWGDSPVNVTTNKGTITAHITAFHCIETGIGEQLDGWIPQTVAPGNDQVTWNILTTLNGVSPSIHLSGLAANFPNGYVVQTITAARGATPQFDGVTFTDGVTPSHSDYTTTYYKKNVGTDGTAKDGTIGLSSPSRAYTSDTLQIQCDNQSAGRNSVLSGFIITDKPVASTPAYSLPFVPPGGTISLSPGVIGVPPMSYQWRTNGVPIPGATSATYTKTGANGADNANYDVVVINAYGSVTSEVATVTVDLPPAITWATPVTSAGDTDVSTAGTAVLAYDCNGTDQTVNGVSFTAVGSEVTLVGIGSNYKGFAAGTAPPATALSPDYLAVLTGGNYNDGGLATITLNNLIPEHQYQVQVWVNDSRNLNNGQNRTETVTSGGNTVTLKYPANLAGALGQYTIGTFTAKQSSQVITLLGNYSTQLNAIQMRDLGVVTVMPIFIPAPGSYIGPQLVAIHSGPGSTVYYTTDGTTPSSSSPHGASPVLVTLPAPATTTIKAYGTQTGQADSPVVSATYITYTTPAEPTWNNTAGGSWTVASNWVHNAIAGGANVTADFSQLTLTANTAVAFDSSPILGNLVLGDVGNKYSWTFGSGSLTLAATNPPTITVNNQAATINPPLSGVSGLTKTGPGTLTLSGDNPYTGVTTINGGVLVLNTPNFNTYRGGDILINNGSTLRVTQTGGSVRYDFQGKTFAFDSAGGGTIDTGTGVNFVFATAYNVTNRIVTSGGARDSIIGNSGINMGDQPGDATVFDVARGADANSDLTVRVPMGNVGLGGVIKTGSGILELAGTNTYSGPTTVNNGTMVVSGLLPAGGRIMDNGMVVFNRSDTLKVTGAIAGTGALTQNGSGAIELANNPTYTGATTVSNGALRLAGGRVAATTLPVTSGLIARFDAAALTGLANGDTVSIWNDTSGSGNDASLAAGTPTYAAGALNGRAVVRFPGDGNSSFSFPEQSDIKTVFWVVNEANVSLHFLLGDNTAYNFHRGDGGLIWNSTYASSYIQNGTTRKNGAVVNGTTTALGTGWNMLDVVTSGGGVIADQITLDRNIANRSWSGDIAEIIIYNTALTAAQVQQVEDYLNYKWGVGVPANVNLSSSSGVSVAPNALFGGGGSAGNVTVAANGIIEGGYNSAGTLTLSNLTFNGAGTIKVSATAGTTPLVVNNTLALSTTPVSISLANAPTTGTYHLLQFGTLTGTGGFTIPPTRIYTLAINGNYLDLIVSAIAPVVWTGSTSSEWSTNTIASPKNWKLAVGGTPTDFITSDTVNFDDTATRTDVSLLGVPSAGPVTLGNATASYHIGGSGSLQAWSLTKLLSGAVTFNNNGGLTVSSGTTVSNGVLTLANGAANTLGAVTVNGGTLIVDSTNTAVSVTIGTGGTVQIGNTDANGSLAQNITDNGSLLFNRSDAFTYGNVVSGSGTLTKNAAGTLTLTAEHSYTGDTIVNGGVLVFNYPGSTYFTYNGGNLFINNRATLRFTGSRYDLSGKIFTFDSNGGGVLDTVSGLNFVAWAANTYTTTGGAQNSIIGSSGMNVNAGVIDIFDLARGTGPSDLKVAAPIWNTGGITKIGNGILELAGVNTYSGGTTVAAGTLLVTGQLTGNGPVTVDDNAALKVTARGAISAITNATDLTLGSSGASTLGFVNLSSTNVAPINVANVYVNGTVTISVSGGLGVGQLPLIKYSTSEALAGTFTLALPAGVSATLVDNTANQSLDLNVTAAPASILTDLSGTTNYLYAGGTYTASVVGAGSAPLTYLWKKNGTIPVGANSPTLTLSNVTTNDSGSYSVTVTNTLGSAHSATNYLVVLPPSGYSAIVMAAGPTAYWPLNESAGYVATDYSSGYNGTYTSGGVTYGVAGPVGNTVVTLDGSSGSVSIPYTSALNPSGPFTVELWVNPTQVPFPGSVAYVASSVEVNGNRSGWYLAQDNGTTFSHGSAFVVRLFNQNSTTPTITLWAPVTASGWYYLTLTYDGTTAALYENGVLATSGTAGYVGNVDAPFTIGKRSDGAYSWPGSVGDVAVYGRALTAQEIQTHAQIAPSLQIGRVGQQVVLTWSGSGTLQAAPVVTGPYTNVPAATSPWTNTPSAGSEFWRVKF